MCGLNIFGVIFIAYNNFFLTYSDGVPYVMAFVLAFSSLNNELSYKRKQLPILRVQMHAVVYFQDEPI